jgi:hypothetical protein
MEVNTPIGKAEMDEFFSNGEPFKARMVSDGEPVWLISAGDYVRFVNMHDVLDVVNRINEQFGLNDTRDELLLGVTGVTHTCPDIWSEIGFRCVYNNINEALDYLVEGLKQDDFYDMLEVIERKD